MAKSVALTSNLISGPSPRSRFIAFSILIAPSSFSLVPASVR